MSLKADCCSHGCFGTDRGTLGAHHYPRELGRGGRKAALALWVRRCSILVRMLPDETSPSKIITAFVEGPQSLEDFHRAL
jgi:hypothetical protein